MPDSNFSKIINPVSQDDFFKEFYEKGLLHSKISDDQLFNKIILAVRDVFNVQNLRYPDVRLVKSGAVVEMNKYVDSYIYNEKFEFKDVIKKDVLLDEFKNGASVVITHAQKLSFILNQISEDIYNETGIKNHINIYLSPPHSQGYKLHYDRHDVLVLQLIGNKKWEVYNSVGLEIAKNYFMENLDKLIENEKKELLLKEKDFLYLPRGTFHNVFTSDSHSLHVTIGLLGKDKEKIEKISKDYLDSLLS